VTSPWWWRALGGRDAASWPVLLIPVVIAIPTAIINASGWGMQIGTAAFGQAAGVTFMLAVLILARLTWLRPQRETEPGGLLVVLTFAVASVARLIDIAVGFRMLGVLDQWPADVSLISGGVGQTIVLCIGAITVNAVRSHARTMSRLDSIRHQLEHVRALTLDQVRRVQQDVADEVLASARTLLEGVRADSDAPRVADAVRRAAVEVVRPASHDLHSGESIASRMQELDRPARFRSVIAGVRPLAPVLGPVVYEVLVSSAIWGWYGANVALINLIIATPMLVGGNFVLRSLWRRRRPRRWATAWLFLAYSLSNLLALVVLIGVTAAFGHNTTDLVAGFAVYPLAMVIGSILFSVVERQAESERALSRAVDDESREMARVLRMAEDERRRLARVMHGEVQAELTAAAAKLAAVKPGDSGAAVAVAVVEELMERLSRVDLSGSAERRQTLAELWETWSLAIALDVHVTPEVQRLLITEPRLQERVVPIVSEAITNAIRHGVDSGVTVDVDACDSLVTIEVRNQGVLTPGVTGLGTVEIDHFAESWSVRQEGPEVVFTAIVRSASEMPS